MPNMFFEWLRVPSYALLEFFSQVYYYTSQLFLIFISTLIDLYPTRLKGDMYIL